MLLLPIIMLVRGVVLPGEEDVALAHCRVVLEATHSLRRRVLTGWQLHPTISCSTTILARFTWLAQPSRALTSPPPTIQIGILNLVRHLVSDMSVWESVKKVSGRAQARQREDKVDRVGGGLVRLRAPMRPMPIKQRSCPVATPPSHDFNTTLIIQLHSIR